MTVVARNRTMAGRLVFLGALCASPLACNFLLGTEAADHTPVYDAGTEATIDVDASSASDATVATGCSRYPDASFCNDFDGVNPLGTNFWTFSDEGSARGTIAITQAHATSPPNALRIAGFVARRRLRVRANAPS